MSKISSKEEVVAERVTDVTTTTPKEGVQTPDPLALAMANWGMDATCFTEFRIVDNVNYSQEIIDGARAVYDPEKLESLKAQTDRTELYEEGKKQILAQCHADQALNVHSDMFRVLLQVNVGSILNLIEPTFEKKGEYIKWVKENFKGHQIRYFQQARQLADMGDFAKTYAAVGKNRLLALEVLKKVEKMDECMSLFTDHPFPDTTADEGGYLLKRHIDSVITLHRLINAGVSFATFKQAALIASNDNEALGVRKAKEVKKWLDKQAEDQRQGLFDRLVQDKMAYPPDNPYKTAPKASLDKVLADLLNGYGGENLANEAWVAKQRELQIMDSLLQAQRLIAQLIERIGVEAPKDDVPTETQSETQAA